MPKLADNVLTDFDKALCAFESNAYSALHQYVFDAGRELRNFQIQIRAQSLASDIGYFAMVLRDMHAIAINHVSEEMNRENAEHKRFQENYVATNPGAVLDEKFWASAPKARARPILIPAKFGATFKAFFYFVRAYQDGLYRLGKVIHGMELKRNVDDSMKSAIDVKTKDFVAGNLVGDTLRATCPEYAPWFVDMRELRNKIKDGIGVSYSSGKNFSTGETTVGVQFRLPKTDEWPTVSLETATTALTISSKATDGIIQVGKANGKLTSKIIGA